MPRSTAAQRQLVRDFGTCLSFNGTSDKVVTTLWGSSLTYSMGAWFKSSNHKQNQQALISVGAGGAGRGQALVLSGSATTDGSVFLLNHVIAWIDLGFKVQDSDWHYIFMTTTGSGAATKVWLDGVLRYNSNPTLNAPNTGCAFGSDNTAGFFLGKVDKPVYFASTLSDTAAANMFYGINPSTTPANLYELDEGSGATANDTGSSAKNGTITGATYSTAVVMKPRTTAGTRTLAGARTTVI